MALNSFYGQMLVAMQERLKDQVTELRWIDQDFGQLEVEAERPPVSFPCALIDFTGSQFSQLLQNVELADNCGISVRVVHAPYSNTNHLTPVASKEMALQYYETENKVYKALKGWNPTYVYHEGEEDEETIDLCQPLNRIADGTEKREDALRVRAMMFATSYEDATANNLYEKFEAGLSVEYNEED